MLDVQQAIENARRPLVFGHVNPDADCIGSVVVMATALKAMGKQVGVVLPVNTVSRKYRFLLELTSIPDPIEQPDLIVVTDTAMRNRINKPAEMVLPNAPICNIDHHLGNEKYGQYNWIDSTAASCSQMVAVLVKSLGVTLNPAQATLLYAGVHTDTVGFSLAGTDPNALGVAAELTKHGAQVGWVCQKIYRSLSQSDFRLMQVVYANTKISPCGQYAWSTATHQEILSVGAKPIDIDEQVGVPRSIDGVKIAALFSETRPGQTRINLRAEDDINLLPLARYLGGGGHAQAAGAIIDGDFQEIIDRVGELAVAFVNDPTSLPTQKVEKANVK